MMRGSLMNNTVNTTLCRVKGTAATAGRLKLTQRPSHNADTANWSGVTDTSVTNLTGSVRLRLVRQGDTYTAWLSTNSPAYDAWARVASHTTVFHGAMNVGVFVSRWQDLGPDTLTRTFGNVVARPLVAASTNASDGVTVSWIGDSALTNGTVIGYAVSRAARSVGHLCGARRDRCRRDDLRRRVGRPGHLLRLQGSRLRGRRAGDQQRSGRDERERQACGRVGQPSPAALKGVYAEYYKPRTPGTLVAARVDEQSTTAELLRHLGLSREYAERAELAG